MEKKTNSNIIRGVVLQQKEQTIAMNNQINRYKEALKRAQGKPNETMVNGIKVDRNTIKEKSIQEFTVKQKLNHLDNNHQNLQTQTKSSNKNKHNTESLIDFIKSKFRNFFSHTN
ncbi:hypothetical protein [Priestia megaterium]|uniref:hypothetical protein n=1 Tax=Priestia megaterium TaxID=1404 RepID=UPI0022B8D6F4|nr:hypothetical protein [Priestia megaterium]MCZ8497508.1 hypothetical protein [Priestia megaterium]